jgi:SAM-dependent methyltransferase
LSGDAKLCAPPVQRNRDHILDVLRRVLPASGVVLEVASGSGEHARYFAEALPGLIFQPSDPDATRRASIDAWADGMANIRPALDLDAAGDWPALLACAVICINMIHISPWEATEGLMRHAAAVLAPGGVLVTYGPYRRGGAHTAPSNAAFDADLRARDPRWGVRDVEAVSECAARHGFAAPEITEMPANNLTLVFRKTA